MANSKNIIRLIGGQATANDDLAVFGAILSTGVVKKPSRVINGDTDIIRNLK